jgi:uncharacterized iron-regulated protein
VILCLLALLPFVQWPPVGAGSTPAPAYLPQRVYDTHRKAFTDFEMMLADLAHADVVFVGEEHDDPNTHRLELAVLEGLMRRHPALILSMEMFERDAQPALDRYVAGESTEEQFLSAARPWPRYKADYRPSVEFARAHHLPVVASNVPRRIASEVSKNGADALASLGTDRPLAAADVHCPTSGDYYERFAGLMKEHPGGAAQPSADAREKNDRFYLAQCLKDETMGESIARALQTAANGSMVLHLNGSFHSDFGEGAVESARRRLPGKRLVVVSIVPVSNLDDVQPDRKDRKRAQYLLYTITAIAPASPR